MQIIVKEINKPMKPVDWIHTIESKGYHVRITNGGNVVKIYRPEDMHKYRDKAEPFAVMTVWPHPVTWKPQQA